MRRSVGQERARVAWGLSLVIALVAAGASAHLLPRGVPLSKLAVASPVAVMGHVATTSQDTDGRRIVLDVEESVLGDAPAGRLAIALEGHHAPDYAAGMRVLVFLNTGAPPWTSEQTALDLVEIPAPSRERHALLAAVRDYATLRAADDTATRIARLKALALSHLDSASQRVRHEALVDLVAIASAGTGFSRDAIEHIAALTQRPEPTVPFTPGLVVLLAAIQGPDAHAALVTVLREATNPQTRARAARVIGVRRTPEAGPVLRAALDDPALAVRLTAERALQKIDSSAASAKESDS